MPRPRGPHGRANLADLRAATEVEKKQAVEQGLRKVADEATRRAAEEEKAQEQAAAALVNLARDSEDNRVSIVDAGGIPALLELLNG